MNTKIKYIFLLLALLALPSLSTAQNVLPNCGLLGLSCRPIEDIILNLVKWLLGIFGFIAVIAFIISGIQYLISAGNENMQERAKKNLIYSITGVIVGLSGLIIVYAVQKILLANPTI
jgi:hypothetical protein